VSSDIAVVGIVVRQIAQTDERLVQSQQKMALLSKINVKIKNQKNLKLKKPPRERSKAASGTVEI